MAADVQNTPANAPSKQDQAWRTIYWRMDSIWNRNTNSAWQVNSFQGSMLPALRVRSGLGVPKSMHHSQTQRLKHTSHCVSNQNTVKQLKAHILAIKQGTIEHSDIMSLHSSEPLWEWQQRWVVTCCASKTRWSKGMKPLQCGLGGGCQGLLAIYIYIYNIHNTMSICLYIVIHI